MPVRMLRDERIAIDGLVTRWYRAGDIIHDVPPRLAAALVRDGIATEKLTPEAELPPAHQPKQEYAPKSKRR